MIFDAIGNELKEGALVRVDIRSGFVIGKIHRIDTGSIISPSKSNMIIPTTVHVAVEVNLSAPPSSAIRNVLCLREPQEAPAIAGAGASS